MNNPSPRLLLLRLLTVADNHILNISEAILAGSVFGITENSIRVTMARLTQAELAEAIAPATYRLGPKAQKLGDDVALWHTSDRKTIESDGSWIAVATSGLPRSDRKILRARDRALSLLGFREMDRGLYIRPNNLQGGIDGVRKRLLNLGLGEDAIVFKACDFDDQRQKKALWLWSDMQLAEHYEEMSYQLNHWLEHKEGLRTDVALREVFMLGDAGIRSVIFDPLLPAPLVDEAARQQYFNTVRRFNDEGRRLWLAFFDTNLVRIDET
ncbi:MULTISPECIES: PaaX family transcriptional regulator [unclassified Psychrobacter]|uniref:PaaX family transcriptional regulator n=1 Tax=unclassified Psychrobacter TaxID=196806 RepID=UPI0025FC15D7|nr:MULTISPECIES: PaaX family transcriptional regulator [unclassified Psychrobacter]